MASTTARAEVMLEYSAMNQPSHCPLGMYVLPAANDPFVWTGVLFIHRGYYAGAVLRFTLSIPHNYPNAPPVVTVQSPIQHPLVDQRTSRVKLDGRFPRWRPRTDFIYHVLHYIKAMFKRSALDSLTESSCANMDVYRIYRDDIQLFIRLVKQTVELSVEPSTLYDPPLSADGVKPSAIRFRLLENGEEDKLMTEVEEAGKARLASSRRMGMA